LPASISCPFLEVSSYLELPPCATYAALNLWNFTTLNPGDSQDLTDPDNLAILNSFTGTDDERWFFVISVAIEACGAKVIPLVLNAIGAVNLQDHERVTQLLVEITEAIGVLSKIFQRMHEKCNPDVFYHQIRPLLAGSKNMAAVGLPNGVFYDRGEGVGEWRQYSGGSNAQSSLIQLFDIALGVEHWASGDEATSTTPSQLKGSLLPPAHRTFMMVCSRWKVA
jgi:indoleamine 2,3-dioxygenase